MKIKSLKEPKLCCRTAVIISCYSLCQPIVLFDISSANRNIIVIYFIFAVLIQLTAILLSCFSYMNSADNKQHMKAILCLIFANLSFVFMFCICFFLILFVVTPPTWGIK